MASSQSSSSTTQAQPSCCQCALASVNVASFVSAKLRRDKNSNNYKSWKEQMLCLIESQDLLGYIAGEISPPPMTSEAYAVWRRRDRLVKGWILGALSDEVVETAVNLNSARDVWLHLEKAFIKPRGPPPQAAAEQEKDWNEYLPLYIAALRGDWVTAREILDQDPNAVKARVSFTSETALHIAVGTGKSIPFVEKLVDMMPDESLALTDELGFNALHVAARTGNVAAAKILIHRLEDLLYVKSNYEFFPAHEAAKSAQRDTLLLLISQNKDDFEPNPCAGANGVSLLNAIIDADFFDIALHLVGKYPHTARIELPYGNSALKRIALKESAFLGVARFNFWERFISSSVQLEMESKVRHGPPNRGDIEDPTCGTRIYVGK